MGSLWMTFVVLCFLFEAVDSLDETDPCESPVYCYGELLESVQLMEVFQDSKTFVDMPLKTDIDTVLDQFDSWKNRSREGLLEFVNTWFDPVGSDLMKWTPPDWQESPQLLSKIENQDYQEWARDLNRRWKDFGKEISDSAHKFPDQHSIIAVNNPFIAPGGRFREFYYWDSYWIIKGLLLCGMTSTAKGMIQNMAQLIDEFGFVPNGGRVYYTMRSQPPLLTWMVWDYYQATKEVTLVTEVLPLLDIEYQFWMMNRSLVYQECNCVVNHYNCPVTGPRPESYREDVTTASHLPEDERHELYSNLASGAESGWDFSSRWFGSSGTLTSIRAKDIIPVDLNSFMAINEILLEKLHNVLPDSTDIASMYKQAWQERLKHFDKVFWDEGAGLWSDRIIGSKKHLPGFYASSLVPIYMKKIANLSNSTQETIAYQTLTQLGVLDYPGGLPTSLNKTSKQQWDFPNVWAPLEWFLVEGWRESVNSSLRKVAESLATKWLRSNYAGWINYNGSMFEKYNCSAVGEPGAGGEYFVQSGFGWTNGVVLDFLNMYPRSAPPPSTAQTGTSNQTIVLSVLLSVLVCVIIVMVPCVIWCRWIYVTGKRKYWSRVRQECTAAMQQSSSNDGNHDASIFENPGAKEWSENEADYDVDL